MEGYEWNSSIGYLLSFLIICASFLWICCFVVLIKNWWDNRQSERQHRQYVVQYTPDFEDEL